MCAARAYHLTVNVAGRLAGGGASRGFLFNRVLNRRLRRLIGTIGRLSIPIRIFGALFAGLLLRGSSKTSSTTSLDLSICRLQQTETTDSPRATGKNQEENSPTPRQHIKERQKTGNQGKNTQTSCNQQGNTARARSIKVGQRRGLCVLHDRNLVRVRGSRGRFANLRNRSRIGRRVGGFLHRVGGTGRSLRKSGRGQGGARRHRMIGGLVRLRLIQ